ncbi:MAG TPA: SDR family oxidoreductase [Gemmatimonadaceae bacterium]|nr:SDR family oxidoreductase [Gemmatimonadaceae bacterium]
MDSTSPVTVITGASAGIGAELARQLGRAGHRLVLAARREEELRRVATEAGDEARPIVTDVRSRADVERLRDAALEAFGQVDVWVNNAGRGIGVPVLELTDEQFDEMMQVNVKSALYGMQAIVPHFQQRNAGHLINVSSFLGRVPLASYRSAYNAAKAALNALTANLRMDLGRTHPGIRVSLVMPGIVRTEFAGNALGGTPQAQWNAAAGGRGGGPQAQTVEEVAAAIAALIAEPRAELYTNRASAGIAKKYFEDVEGFEAGMR